MIKQVSCDYVKRKEYISKSGNTIAAKKCDGHVTVMTSIDPKYLVGVCDKCRNQKIVHLEQNKIAV